MYARRCGSAPRVAQVRASSTKASASSSSSLRRPFAVPNRSIGRVSNTYKQNVEIAAKTGVDPALTKPATTRRNPFSIFNWPHKWLSAPDAPSPTERYSYNSYHRYGLLRDDFYSTEVPAIKEAVRRLPKKLREARDMRMKRASDLYIKKQFLPENEWTTPYEDVPYLDEYLTEVNKETSIRKAFRTDIPTVPYSIWQSGLADYHGSIHRMRREEVPSAAGEKEKSS